MELKTKLSGVFILLRPYSLPGLFVLYYVANVIVTKSLELNINSIFRFVPVFFAWSFMTLLLEAEHKHSNREKIPYSYPAIALVIAIISAIAFNGLTPILPLIFFMGFTYMYIKKNNISILGNVSFISRGFMETSLFFLSLSILSTSYIQMSNILFGLIILLTTSARNLIGDIRDTKFDEVTFTARFGDKLGYVVSILLYLAGAYVLFIVSHGAFGTVLPILLMVLLLIIIDNGHMFHRISVFLSTITMAAYILFLTGNGSFLILLNLIFLSIICNLVFYNLVPRRSNPDDVAIIFGVAPWSKRQINQKMTKSSKYIKNHQRKGT